MTAEQRNSDTVLTQVGELSQNFFANQPQPPQNLQRIGDDDSQSRSEFRVGFDFANTSTKWQN